MNDGKNRVDVNVCAVTRLIHPRILVFRHKFKGEISHLSAL